MRDKVLAARRHGADRCRWRESVLADIASPAQPRAVPWCPRPGRSPRKAARLGYGYVGLELMVKTSLRPCCPAGGG